MVKTHKIDTSIEKSELMELMKLMYVVCYRQILVNIACNNNYTTFEQNK